MPSACPVCGSPVVRKRMASGDRDEVALRCDNLQCPAQKTRRVEYFARRAALDLEGLGGIVADRLVESGLVDEPFDLYGLSEADFAYILTTFPLLDRDQPALPLLLDELEDLA